MGPSRASLNEEQSDRDTDDTAAAVFVSVRMNAMCMLIGCLMIHSYVARSPAALM